VALPDGDLPSVDLGEVSRDDVAIGCRHGAAAGAGRRAWARTRWKGLANPSTR
jgi:hypothetical protein